MELKLITYVPQTVMFTSDINTLFYSTDLDKVIVEVYIPKENYKHLLDTTLYATNGQVALYDVRELVEQYMREQKIIYLEFCIEVYNEGGEAVVITAFKVLFCSFKPTLGAVNYMENLLILGRAKQCGLTPY